jgi:hypothetical protein
MSHYAGREPAPASPAPSVPRLRLGAVLSRGTLLDGGWWPRSADPAAELPGLIAAAEGRCGARPRPDLKASTIFLESWLIHERGEPELPGQ